jgi:hypothetical protein
MRSWASSLIWQTVWDEKKTMLSFAALSMRGAGTEDDDNDEDHDDAGSARAPTPVPWTV